MSSMSLKRAVLLKDELGGRIERGQPGSGSQDGRRLWPRPGMELAVPLPLRDIGKADFVMVRVLVRVPEFGVHIGRCRWGVDMLGPRKGAGREAGGESSVGFRGDLGERFHRSVLRVG